MNENPTYIKNRKELINEQYEKYGYHFCEKKGCGTSKAYKFEVHHIIFRSEAPDHPSLHSKENLIIVCTNCHNKKENSFHNKKSERNYLIKERKLNEIFDINV